MKRTLLKTGAVILAIVLAISGTAVAFAQDDTGVAPSNVRVLSVDGPGSTTAGEQVVLTVTDRESGVAIEGAGVYALSRPSRVISVTSVPNDYSCLFLGKSAGDGKVSCTFSKPGGFLLIATKDGYGPSLARLVVKPDILGKLSIKAPRQAQSNETATIQVIQDRKTGEAAPDADVWAVRLPLPLQGTEETPSSMDVPRMKEIIKEAINGDITVLTDELNDYAYYLGQTDSNGEVQHTFGDTGIYILLAVKDKYIPGISRISIVSGDPTAHEGLFPQFRQRLGDFRQRLENFNNERFPKDNSPEQNPRRGLLRDWLPWDWK